MTWTATTATTAVFWAKHTDDTDNIQMPDLTAHKFCRSTISAILFTKKWTWIEHILVSPVAVCRNDIVIVTKLVLCFTATLPGQANPVVPWSSHGHPEHWAPQVAPAKSPQWPADEVHPRSWKSCHSPVPRFHGTSLTKMWRSRKKSTGNPSSHKIPILQAPNYDHNRGRTTGGRSRTRMKKTYENVHYKWCVSTVFISTSTLLTSDRAGLMHVSCMSIRSKTSSASSLHIWGHQLARIVATVTWARAKPSRNIWDSATFTGTPGRSWAFRLDLGLILIVHIVHIVDIVHIVLA